MNPETVLLSAAAGALAGPVAVAALGRGGRAAVRGADAVMARAGASAVATLAPLRRAGSHGSDPTAAERRRLRIAGALAGGCGGLFLGGPLLAAGTALGVSLWLPRVATWRLARYSRRVEAGAAPAALAMSGALSAGASVRTAIAAAARELEGPIAVELRRAAIEIDAGASVDDALNALVARAPSHATMRIAAAVQLQRRSGGNLASLLRRIAASLEEERRATEEARAATAQARLTSVVVLALPPAGMALAELASPGLIGRMVGSALGMSLVTFALALQVAGALAVRRLARVGD